MNAPLSYFVLIDAIMSASDCGTPIMFYKQRLQATIFRANRVFGKIKQQD